MTTETFILMGVLVFLVATNWWEAWEHSRRAKGDALGALQRAASERPGRRRLGR